MRSANGVNMLIGESRQTGSKRRQVDERSGGGTQLRARLREWGGGAWLKAVKDMGDTRKFRQYWMHYILSNVLAQTNDFPDVTASSHWLARPVIHFPGRGSVGPKLVRRSLICFYS
jgi:hypothetical protein